MGGWSGQRAERAPIRSMSMMARAWAAKALRASSADVDRLGGEILEEISRSSGGSDSLERIKHLIDAGASVNYQDPKRNETAAHLAASRGYTETLAELLRAGANPHLRDVNGMTPLHKAARAGSIGCVKALLAAGADPEARWATGMTAMHLAAMRHNAPVCSELVRAGAKVGVADRAGKYPEDHALEAGKSSGLAFVQTLKTLRLAEESFEQAREIAAAMAPAPAREGEAGERPNESVAEKKPSRGRRL